MRGERDDGADAPAVQRADGAARRAEELLDLPIADPTEAALAVRRAIGHALLAIYWHLREAPGPELTTRVPPGLTGRAGLQMGVPGDREPPLDRLVDRLVNRLGGGPTRVITRPDRTMEYGLECRTLPGRPTQPGPRSPQPAVLDPLFDELLSALVLTTPHEQSGVPRPAEPAAVPRYVRRAMAAIDADPAHPHTVASLAEMAGVKVRTLQHGFRAHRGVTPMAYLRDVRLTRAHEDLMRPGAGGVAEVAYRWGFTHLGRFAAVYAERFGAPPSHTRNRHSLN